MHRQLILHMNKGFNRFSLDLAGHLLGDANQVFSPFSITFLLAMLLPGTKGKTQQEIEAALQLDRPIPTICDLLENSLDNIVERGEIIKLRNRLFLPDENEINPSYQEALKRSFKTMAQTIDVSDPIVAAAQINQWVSEQTGGMVPRLIDPGQIHSETLLILINTVYLYTTWQSPFEPEDTRVEPFYLKPHLNDQSIDVSMMHKRVMCDAFQDHNQTFTWANIPMKGNLIFQVVLPEPGKYDEVCQHLPTLNDPRALQIARQIDLALPKFDIESRFDLNDALTTLGIEAAFEISDDFDGITESRPLGIGNVIHEAKVTIDEKGVEASAATTIIGFTGSYRPPSGTVPFIVNRPFLFLIWDTYNKALLFAGSVTNPQLA